MVVGPFRVLAVLALVLPAFAQDPASPPKKPQTEDQERIFRELLEDSARDISLEDVKERDIRELVDLVMKVRLTRLLELSDEEAVRVIRIISDRIDRIHMLKWERGAVYYFLREDLKEGAPEEQVEKHLDAATALDVEIAELFRDMIQAMTPHLTTTQRARLFLFGSDFETEIKKLIQQAEDMSAQRRGPVSDKYTRSTKPVPEESEPAATAPGSHEGAPKNR